MAEKKLQLFSIGHSYVVALNRSLMRELNKRGQIEVTVVAPRFFNGDLRPIEIEDEPSSSSLSVIPIDCYLTKYIHFFFYHQKQLADLVSSKNWNYAYLWEEPYIISGFQVAQKLSQKNIPFSLFTNQNLQKKYPFPFSYFENKTLEHCDSLWGCGPQVLQTFRQKKYQGPSEVVPYFVNTERFLPYTDEQKIEFRLKFGLKNLKTIGFMGRLTEEKGVRTFLNSLEQLPGDDWQAVILGDGPLREEIHRWIETKKWQERVFLRLMKHEEIPQILPVLDVLLCPSQTTDFWREQFGRMIIEAFACGVPVIASDSGEIPFVVADAGIVLPEKDQHIWNKTLLQLLADPQRLLLMREKGLKRSQEFSIQTVAQQIEKIILDRTRTFR